MHHTENYVEIFHITLKFLLHYYKTDMDLKLIVYFLLHREAKGNIDRIISNEGNGPPRGPGSYGGGAPTGAGGSMFEMMVPGHKVGLIIGKAGETIKQLQEQSGAKIVIIQVIMLSMAPPTSNLLVMVSL